MAESQFNILGTPGASVQNLVANMGGRTAQTKQSASGLLQTMLSTQSQERMASQGEQGATTRAQIAAGTNRANAQTAQQTALAGMKSQEGMQAKDIDARDRMAAAERRSREWDTKFNAQVQSKLEDKRRALDWANLDYQKFRDDRAFTLAEDAQKLDKEFKEKVFNATMDFNKTQFDLSSMQLKASFELAKAQLGPMEYSEFVNKTVNDLSDEAESQENTARMSTQVIGNRQSELFKANPEVLRGDIYTVLASGFQGAKLDVTDAQLTPQNLPGTLAELGPEGILKAIQVFATTKETLAAQEAIIENNPYKIVDESKRRKFNYGTFGPANYTPDMSKEQQLESIKRQRIQLDDLEYSFHALETSKLPMGGEAKGTLGDNIRLYRSIHEGNTLGAVTRYARDVLKMDANQIAKLTPQQLSQIFAFTKNMPGFEDFSFDLDQAGKKEKQGMMNAVVPIK
jgi:hypothetical protein